MPKICAFAALLLTSVLGASAASAEPTRYPLTIRNCGTDLTFDKAPGRVVSIGQSNTEILLALGLGSRIVGTAVWFGPVLPDYAAENARIPRLADNGPSFESVIGQRPDMVTVQYESYVGAHGSVGRPEQFAGFGIPAYLSPADCAAKDNSGSGDGVRREPLTMEPTYQEIRDTAAIFDVTDRGEAVVGTLKKREADAIAAVSVTTSRHVPVLFWFSSREVAGDAFAAGKNGAPAYMLTALGDRNVITVNDEWPTVSWEAISAANPTVIVLARMDRRRFPADAIETKLKFLQTDPVVSRMEAVQKQRFVVMDAQSMNPGMRLIDGIEVLAKGIASFGLDH